MKHILLDLKNTVCYVQHPAKESFKSHLRFKKTNSLLILYFVLNPLIKLSIYFWLAIFRIWYAFFPCRYTHAKISVAPTASVSYLLHLGSSTSEQLDIPLPQDLLVLFEGILGVLFAGEKHKGVARGPSVRVLDKEQTLIAICNWALRTEEGQHFVGRGCEWQAPHADDDLVLFGQKLGHLIGCTWCQRMPMI